MSGTIHMSKCPPIICNSEDDTIMEEYSHHQKENYAPKHQHPHKIATILRSRSCRDREVLSEYLILFLLSIVLRFCSLIIKLNEITQLI